MYNETYEQEIDLKDLFFSVLYRWRILLLAALAGAVLLGVCKTAKSVGGASGAGAKAAYEASLESWREERLGLETTIRNLKSNIEDQSRYLAEAPLMQIDPYNEPVATVEFVIVPQSAGDEELAGRLSQAYQFALFNGAYIENIAAESGIEAKYLRDLLSVSADVRQERHFSGADVVEGPETLPRGALCVTAIGSDKAMAEKIIDAVVDEAGRLKAELSRTVGLHDIVVMQKSVGERVDMKLSATQQLVRDNVEVLDDSLDDFNQRLGKLGKPASSAPGSGDFMKSVLKYMILGFLAGGFVAVFACCVAYILNDRVVSDKEIKSRFALKNLGTFAAPEKKRKFDVIDRWLKRLAGEEEPWPDDMVYEMIVTNIRNYAGDKKTLLLTGMASESRMQSVGEMLGSSMPGYTITVGGNILEQASARRLIKECEGVILLEERDVSRYSRIQRELEIVANVGAEVVGVIVG